MVYENKSICNLYSETNYTCNKSMGRERGEGWISKIIENFIDGSERVCGGDSLSED